MRWVQVSRLDHYTGCGRNYQWEASRDYNAAPKLEEISAPLLAINSADDERNPPEFGLMDTTMNG